MNHVIFDSTRLASKLLRAAQLVQGKEHLAHDSAIPKINSTKTQKNKKKVPAICSVAFCILLF